MLNLSKESVNEGYTISEMLGHLCQHERKYSTDNDSILAMAARPFTNNHHSKIDDVIEDFMFCLSSYSNNKWTNFLSSVPFQGLQGESRAPAILVVCGGHVTPSRLTFINKALIDWQAVTQKKSRGSGSFGWYQPSTQNQRLRIFLGNVKQRFDWRVQVTDLNFPGGLSPFLNRLYAERLKAFGKVSQIILTIFF